MDKYRRFILEAYRDGDKVLAITKLMESRGFKNIAYGSYAAIYQGKNSGQIIKIFEQDACYKDFVKLIQKNPNNPHFPKIRKLAYFRKKLFSGLNLLKMEALKPLTVEEYKENVGFHCYCITKIPRHPYSISESFSIARGESKRSVGEIRNIAYFWGQDNPKFAECIDLIAKGMKNRCREDLHRTNIMKRSDGTWVIIDPYYENS